MSNLALNNPSYKIILLIDFSEEYGRALLRGISEYSKEKGPWVFCRMPLFYRESLGIDGILKWAKEWEANGIIGQFYNDDDIYKILDAGLPLITQDFKERFSGIPNITGGYYETGVMAAEYFLARGHKHFAFYGFSNIVWSRERSNGFEERLKNEGYAIHFYETKENNSRELWYYKPSPLSEWLNNLPKPIAIMACDDNQGQYLSEACKIAGIKIPEEVSIIGVDNDEVVCNLSDPPLSSIALDVEKGGYEAAKLLDNFIKGRSKKLEDILVKPVNIITRLSSDIYATSDVIIAQALKYIHQNYYQQIEVKDVLSVAPLSRRAFEKRFLKVTGYPVYKYINKLKIDHFANKLIETNQSIYEIAIDTGFSDSKNVSRIFKKEKGLSPIQYRLKYKLNR